MRAIGQDYYSLDEDLISTDLAAYRQHYKAKGFCILVDGTRITRRTAPAAAKVLQTITGTAQIYRNIDGELAVNYDHD